ncbi:hypothetical protein HDU96_000151, partial [Phlyctochytrium bullatum]
LPLLEFLTEQFSRSKMWWAGGRPTEKGQFMKAFLLTVGFDAYGASNSAKVIKQERIVENSKRHSTKDPNRPSRRVIGLDPAQILPSFRPVVQEDYTDFPRECLESIPLLFRHLRKLVIEDHATSLLGYDLISLGHIFLEYCNKLLGALGDDKVVAQSTTISCDEIKSTYRDEDFSRRAAAAWEALEGK